MRQHECQRIITPGEHRPNALCFLNTCFFLYIPCHKFHTACSCPAPFMVQLVRNLAYIWFCSSSSLCLARRYHLLERLTNVKCLDSDPDSFGTQRSLLCLEGFPRCHRITSHIHNAKQIHSSDFEIILGFRWGVFGGGNTSQWVDIMNVDSTL